MKWTVWLCVVAQAGCTCIIDPCPQLVRRELDWSTRARVAQIELDEATRVELSSSEPVALISGSFDEVSLSELLAASPGDQLQGGGRFLGMINGSHPLEPAAEGLRRIGVVRLQERGFSLELEAIFEWDVLDCDESPIAGPTFREMQPVCGDGMVEEPEACDDENDQGDDGCDDCQIASSGCDPEAPTQLSFWTCEGEPSQCERQACSDDPSEPSCTPLDGLSLELITSGLVLAGDEPGLVTSDPEGLECSCEESAVVFECSLGCAVDLLPCTSLTASGTGEVAFDRWADGCSGSEGCSLEVETSRVIGLFEGPATALEREGEWVAYPEDGPGLDLRLLDAGGGLVVAAGDLSGELEDPEAPPLPEDAEPRFLLMALDEQLAPAWTREDLVVDGGALRITDMAVDGAGEVLLLGGLFGELALEGGSVTVDTPDLELTPQQAVLIRFSALGEHLWSRLVNLPVDYDLRQARLDVNEDGVASLVAIVDYELFDEAESLDLVTAAVSPEGDFLFLQRLRPVGDASAQIELNPELDTAIDAGGNVFLAAGVSGAGPFAYTLPDDPDGDGERLMVAKFAPDGLPLWSKVLPSTALAGVQAAADAEGRAIVMTRANLASFAADGQLRWVNPITARTFAAFSEATSATRRLALEPETGEIVLAAEASTITRTSDTEEHFLATLTSRLAPQGGHQWTVRSESWEAERLLRLRSVAVVGDQVFVLGLRYQPGEANHTAVIRRIVEDW